MAASKQTDIHTHMRNAVTLVWGSPQLTHMLLHGTMPLHILEVEGGNPGRGSHQLDQITPHC